MVVKAPVELMIASLGHQTNGDAALDWSGSAAAIY
jgi:hypothetical protein